MPPQQTLNEKVEDYRRDLDAIDRMLESLKREYDLYFAGARKRPPFEMRTSIERMLRKWRTSTIQKLELTFRLNSLNAKYIAMTDVWEKVQKRREVDPKALSPYGPSSAHLAEEFARAARGREGSAEAPAAGTPAAAAARAREALGPQDQEAHLRRVFNDYLDAKKDLGESIDITFDRFKNQVEKQIDKIRTQTQCKDVQFGVIRKDGKVSLTAKPVKG